MNIIRLIMRIINYFYDVFNYFQNGQDKMNLKEYEKILENPEVIE